MLISGASIRHRRRHLVSKVFQNTKSARDYLPEYGMTYLLRRTVKEKQVKVNEMASCQHRCVAICIIYLLCVAFSECCIFQALHFSCVMSSIRCIFSALHLLYVASFFIAYSFILSIFKLLQEKIQFLFKLVGKMKRKPLRKKTLSIWALPSICVAFRVFWNTLPVRDRKDGKRTQIPRHD